MLSCSLRSHIAWWYWRQGTGGTVLSLVRSQNRWVPPVPCRLTPSVP